MKIYMVRHGESECNVRQMLYGRTDCALTEKGCAQAREVGEKLRGVIGAGLQKAFLSNGKVVPKTAGGYFYRICMIQNSNIILHIEK